MSGIAGYDVRVRSGRTGGPLGGFNRVLTDTDLTSRRLEIGSGRTSCLSVRARARAGHVGPWSAGTCVSRPAS